jgi:transcriptional regulator with XRE-family HTH domain
MTHSFALWLGQKLHDIGWSQDTLAKRIGVKQASVSKWISGKTKPSRENVVKLANILEESPDKINRLLGYSKEKPKDQYLETVISLWDGIPDWKKRDIVAQVRNAGSEENLSFSELVRIARRLTADQREEILRIVVEQSQREQGSGETA